MSWPQRELKIETSDFSVIYEEAQLDTEDRIFVEEAAWFIHLPVFFSLQGQSTNSQGVESFNECKASSIFLLNKSDSSKGRSPYRVLELCGEP